MRNKRFLPVVAGIIFVGFALTGLAFGVEGPSIGAVSSLIGDVNTLHKDETAWNPAALGLGVYQYDTVKTGEKSKVRITFEDGSLLNLSETTELEIKEHVYTPEDKRRTSLLKMTTGKMRVLCQKLTGEGSRFQVETPTAVIGIRGTQFIIWVVSNELTTVICLEDEVYVRNTDETVAGEVILKPNQMTKIGVGIPPLPATIAPEELRSQLETDTAAYKVTPAAAHPEAALAAPAPEPEAEAEVGAPWLSRGADVLADEDSKLPSVPPMPQDPADNPEFKPEGLPEPPPAPGLPHIH